MFGRLREALDRPALKLTFDYTSNTPKFKEAIGDSIRVVNIGVLLSGGPVVFKTKGKSHIRNVAWRNAMDEVEKDLTVINSIIGDKTREELVAQQSGFEVDRLRREVIAALNGILGHPRNPCAPAARREQPLGDVGASQVRQRRDVLNGQASVVQLATRQRLTRSREGRTGIQARSTTRT
jgi:hypothetical protein